jgi:ABC-2 type transport system permease protein
MLRANSRPATPCGVIGLYAKSPQSADFFSMLPAFLPGFVSNVFVDTTRMPAGLREVADWNPMSAVVAASRKLFANSQGVAEPAIWPLQHPVVATLAMSLAILAVMAPAAVRRYSRTVR